LGTVAAQHIPPLGGRILSDDADLLEQRATKQRQKLEQARTVAELTQARFDEASAAHAQAERERDRKESALELAKGRAKRLAKETKAARRLSEALAQDCADAENELAELLQEQEKRQAKLAKAEASLAAAQAAQKAEQAASRTTPATRKRPATAAKKGAAPRKRTSAKKATAKRTTTRRK
jgi:chromosome segregation ATPase